MKESLMMTAKDFKVLASKISQMMDPVMRLNAAIAVANACMEINPRFNLDKFFDACNLKSQSSKS
jgi:hypothetical protein